MVLDAALIIAWRGWLWAPMTAPPRRIRPRQHVLDARAERSRRTRCVPSKWRETHDVPILQANGVVTSTPGGPRGGRVSSVVLAQAPRARPPQERHPGRTAEPLPTRTVTKDNSGQWGLLGLLGLAGLAGLLPATEGGRSRWPIDPIGDRQAFRPPRATDVLTRAQEWVACRGKHRGMQAASRTRSAAQVRMF